MMAHAPGCACALCTNVRARALPTIQADRDALARAWHTWRGVDDGEVRKLLAGDDGAPGSPRWVALQAIAATRIGGQG